MRRLREVSKNRKRKRASAVSKSRKKKEKPRNETEEERETKFELQRERMKREPQRGQYNLAGEAFRYDPTREYSKYEHVVIGKMDQVCQFCGVKKFSREPQGMCSHTDW